MLDLRGEFHAPVPTFFWVGIVAAVFALVGGSLWILYLNTDYGAAQRAWAIERNELTAALTQARSGVEPQLAQVRKERDEAVGELCRVRRECQERSISLSNEVENLRGQLRAAPTQADMDFVKRKNTELLNNCRAPDSYREPYRERERYIPRDFPRRLIPPCHLDPRGCR